MRRPVILLLAVALAQMSLAAPALAARKPSKVQQRQASLRAAKARLAQVTAQLQSQQVRSQAADQAVVAARAHLAIARSQLSEVEHHLDAVRTSVRAIALRVYINGVTDGGLSQLAAMDPGSAARADFLRSSVIGIQSDAADSLAATEQDLQGKRKAAESAAKIAADRQRTASQALAALKASQAQQAKLADVAEADYEASLSEAALASRTILPRGAHVDLTTVHGITVATSIAGNLDRMLNAADASGYHFSGSGYRSESDQVALRRAHCGSSDYDVYDKPAGQCHPPTARPGQSLHEQGLAVDFSYNGSIINSHSNPGFQWLSAHAAGYGFYNLPSEAWHWSVNGN